MRKLAVAAIAALIAFACPAFAQTTANWGADYTSTPYFTRAYKGGTWYDMFAFDGTKTNKTTKGITIGASNRAWVPDASTNLLSTGAPLSGTRVALNGVDWTGVTFSGCAYKSQGFCILPNGAFNDTSSVMRSLNTFMEGQAWGTASAGIVHRANRLALGEAAVVGQLGIGGGPNYSALSNSYIEKYLRYGLSTATLVVGSPNGYIGGFFYNKSSDYEALFSQPSAGPAPIVSIAVDDGNLGSIAAGSDIRCLRAPTGNGICVNQVDTSNMGPVVDMTPFSSTSSGLTEGWLVTTGISPRSSATVTISVGTPGVVTWTGHGMSNNDSVNFTSTGSFAGSGLTANTVYYARNVTANTFEVAATPGGASIATTGAITGTITAVKNATNPSSALLVFGRDLGQGSSPSRKGIVIRGGTLDTSVGTSGGGVFAELADKMETRYYKSDNTVGLSTWGDATSGLFVVSGGSGLYATGNVTATQNVVTQRIVGSAAAVAVSSCGTSPPAATGTSISGTFTTGTGAPTSCTLAYASAYPNDSACSVTPMNAAAVATSVRISGQSKSGFIVTFGAGVTSGQYSFVCAGW